MSLLIEQIYEFYAKYGHRPSAIHLTEIELITLCNEVGIRTIKLPGYVMGIPIKLSDTFALVD